MKAAGRGYLRAATGGLAAALTAAALIVPRAACSERFPEKPIRIIASAPGGTSDFTSRLIGRGLTDNLGQQVIVDNRGNFGGEIAAKAPADGYTLIVDGASLWLAPLMQKSPYDPVRDLAPVTIATRSPTVVLVHPSLPVATRVLNRPDVKERHFNVSVETVGSSPEEFGATVQADIAKWEKVIRSAGIRTE